MKTIGYLNYLLIFIALSLGSCQKESADYKLAGKNATDELKSNSPDIGLYHNLTLDYFYLNQPNNAIIKDAADLTLEFLEQQNVINSTESNYFDSLMVATSYFDIQNNTYNNKYDFLKQKIMNCNLGTSLETTLLSAVDLAEQYPNNPTKVKGYVDKFIANKSWGSDQMEVNVFLDVFDSSYQYWHVYYLAPGSDVIIGDALGALHGSIFGPFGSIIEGAVVSLAINEGWDL